MLPKLQATTPRAAGALEIKRRLQQAAAATSSDQSFAALDVNVTLTAVNTSSLPEPATSQQQIQQEVAAALSSKGFNGVRSCCSGAHSC